MDLAACETLAEVGASLRARGIRLAIARPHARVKAALARGGVALGEDAFFPTVAAAIAGARGER